jgi:hypothetical protein
MTGKWQQHLIWRVRSADLFVQKKRLPIETAQISPARESTHDAVAGK